MEQNRIKPNSISEEYYDAEFRGLDDQEVHSTVAIDHSVERDRILHVKLLKKHAATLLIAMAVGFTGMAVKDYFQEKVSDVTTLSVLENEKGGSNIILSNSTLLEHRAVFQHVEAILIADLSPEALSKAASFVANTVNSDMHTERKGSLMSYIVARYDQQRKESIEKVIRDISGAVNIIKGGGKLSEGQQYDLLADLAAHMTIIS